jgi:murein DD-endopeptidase MepM/ murein hydrolase activator NlpD
VSRRALLAAALLAVTACGIHRAAPPPAGALHPEPDLAGVLHHVKRGETLYRIARTYGLPISELMEANGLTDPRRLEPGTELFVPGASRALEVPPAPAGRTAEAETEPEEAGGRVLRWPLRGLLYSRYGQRQGQRHDGIDIAAPEGTVIGAAAAGKVVFAGEQSGYGSIVILKHQGGLVTLYAHASALLVREGQEVDGGAPIARVGQSGRTTGPHLHFEVREGARPRNPLLYLP